MAGIVRERNGRRAIRFTGTDGARHNLRLGKVTQRAAETVRTRVEHLLSAALTGHALEPETARWLATRDRLMLDKLARAG